MTLTTPPSKQPAPTQDATAADVPEKASEEKLKAALEAKISGEAAKAQQEMTANTETSNRRTDVEPKDFKPHEAKDVRRETMAAAMRAQQAAKHGKKEYGFMSKFPDLVIYVNMGDSEREPGGQLIRRDRKIQFTRGVFRTTDERVAAMIRRHPACGTQLFRETDDESMIHLRRAAAAKMAATTSPTFAGPTSSLDGGELGILNVQRDLAALEDRLMNGA